MNFITAVLSRKPFRRPSDPVFYNRAAIELKGNGVTRVVGPADLEANDWEVKHREATITSVEVGLAMTKVTSAITLNTAQVNTLRRVIEEALMVNE